MTPEDFWRTIDKAASGRTMDHKEATLRSALLKVSVVELLSFHEQLSDASRLLYDWNVYRAATVVLGFTSDDVFADFRMFVISQGRQVFDAVRADVDQGLAAIDIDDLEEIAAAEELSGLADAIYAHRTGRHIYEDFPDRPSPDQPGPELGGQDPGSSRRALKARYPLLSAAHKGRPGRLPEWPLKLAMVLGRLLNRKP